MTDIKHGDKLYVVTRRDLLPGQQAVQAIHAVVEFCLEHPEIARTWHDASNHVALLAVSSEGDLFALADKAWFGKLAYSTFHEPDINDEMTAVVIEPAGARLCKDVELALK